MVAEDLDVAQVFINPVRGDYQRGIPESHHIYDVARSELNLTCEIILDEMLREHPQLSSSVQSHYGLNAVWFLDHTK